MEDYEFMMTEEFVKFSGAIQHIFEKKKAKLEEFKAFYITHQTEIKKYDEEAKMLTEEWNTWKTNVKAKKK